MANKITVPVLFGEKEELYTITVSATAYEWMMVHQLLKILLIYEKNIENMVYFWIFCMNCMRSVTLLEAHEV